MCVFGDPEPFAGCAWWTFGMILNEFQGFLGKCQGSRLAGAIVSSYGFVFLVVWRNDRFSAQKSGHSSIFCPLCMEAFKRIWLNFIFFQDFSAESQSKNISAAGSPFQNFHPRGKDAINDALSIPQGWSA